MRSCLFFAVRERKWNLNYQFVQLPRNDMAQKMNQSLKLQIRNVDNLSSLAYTIER